MDEHKLQEDLGLDAAYVCCNLSTLIVCDGCVWYQPLCPMAPWPSSIKHESSTCWQDDWRFIWWHKLRISAIHCNSRRTCLDWSNETYTSRRYLLSRTVTYTGCTEESRRPVLESVFTFKESGGQNSCPIIVRSKNVANSYFLHFGIVHPGV